MKNLILSLGLLLIAAIAHAQTPIIRNGASSIYYIDGVRVNNIKPRTSSLCVWPEVSASDNQLRIGKTITNVVQFPQRNINSIANTVAGVDSRAGEIPYIRGARPDGTAYYIDGMRIRFIEE